MAAPTPAPPHPPANQVAQVGFSGTREEVIHQIVNHPWPPSWGPASSVSDWVLVNTPSHPQWKGTITVTGYRTVPNPKGSGTAYLSVRWTPED